MNQILHCDWLPGWARWCRLAAVDCTLCSARKIYWSHKIKSFIDQACSVKTAGYWPQSFLHVYGPPLCLVLANIQPSWPHACSIAQISCFIVYQTYIPLPHWFVYFSLSHWVKLNTYLYCLIKHIAVESQPLESPREIKVGLKISPYTVFLRKKFPVSRGRGCAMEVVSNIA